MFIIDFHGCLCCLLLVYSVTVHSSNEKSPHCRGQCYVNDVFRFGGLPDYVFAHRWVMSSDFYFLLMELVCEQVDTWKPSVRAEQRMLSAFSDNYVARRHSFLSQNIQPPWRLPPSLARKMKWRKPVLPLSRGFRPRGSFKYKKSLSISWTLATSSEFRLVRHPLLMVPSSPTKQQLLTRVH